MGMFDYIKCEYPLPDGWNGELQTKDFDCEMVTHIITADGRLMLEGIIESKFHGIVNFYGSEYHSLNDQPARPKGVSHGPDGVKDYTTGEPLKHIWHEYNAKFTDGKLVSISVEDDR